MGLPRFLRPLLAALLLAGCRAMSAQEADPPAAPLDVQTGGHGEPALIFLPGLAWPGTVWDHVVARFEVGYRCHVVTLAGFGGRRAVRTDRFLDEMAAAVIAYAREQNLVRPVLVGHGLGGVLALKIALQAPGLPGRMVLVNALPAPVTIPGKPPPGNAPADRIDAASPDEAAELARADLPSDPATVRQAMAELLTTDLRADLRRIRCPTLVIGGLAGPAAVGRQTYRQQYRNLPGVRFKFLAGARSLPMVDDLDGFTDALRRELKVR